MQRKVNGLQKDIYFDKRLRSANKRILLCGDGKIGEIHLYSQREWRCITHGQKYSEDILTPCVKGYPLFGVVPLLIISHRIKFTY